MKRTKTARPLAPVGSCIILHRELNLRGFPAAEAGPAAIIVRGRLTWINTSILALNLEAGAKSYEWAGARSGVRQSVAIASPWVPDLSIGNGRCIDNPTTWVKWAGLSRLPTNADVIIAWLPSRAVHNFTVATAARHLLETQFGGGAFYEAAGLKEMLKPSEVAL